MELAGLQRQREMDDLVGRRPEYERSPRAKGSLSSSAPLTTRDAIRVRFGTAPFRAACLLAELEIPIRGLTPRTQYCATSWN
jgi:hypothetical protein